MSNDPRNPRTTQPNEGEGNRTAARRYNEATKEFTESGRVAGQARKAAQMSEQEKREAEAAEQAGKAKSRGEDPALYKDGRRDAGK